MLANMCQAALCSEQPVFQFGGLQFTVGYFRPSFSYESGVRIRKEKTGAGGPGVKTLRPQTNPLRGCRERISQERFI